MLTECLYESVQQADMECLAENKMDLNPYKGSRVFITGATGLIGAYLTKVFLCCNRKQNLGMHIVAAVRNREKAERIYGDLLAREDLELYVADVTENIKYEQTVDFIFHAASVTTSKIMVDHPVRTIETAYQGTKNILEFAKNKKVKSVVYISSMEVYGIPDADLDCVREKDLGYIDIEKSRSSYSEGKRICECLCNAYVSEFGVPVKTARLAQTFGAGILNSDNRVYAQFARSVISQEDIVLHSDGTSEGNYCYIRDVAEALLILAVKGKNGEAYNIVNEESHMQIREMAELVANKVAKGTIKVIFDIPESDMVYGYAPTVKMKLSGEKMKKLGWQPKIGLQETYERMIADFK